MKRAEKEPIRIKYTRRLLDGVNGLFDIFILFCGIIIYAPIIIGLSLMYLFIGLWRSR